MELLYIPCNLVQMMKRFEIIKRIVKSEYLMLMNYKGDSGYVFVKSYYFRNRPLSI